VNVLIYNNRRESRFEFSLYGLQAEIGYCIAPGTIIFHYSQLPDDDYEELCEQLIRHVVDFARENHLKIVATCPGVRNFIRAHANEFICVGRVFQPVG
jgi:hypothetical protein